MSAVIVGALLIGLPVIGICAAIVITQGWEGLAFVVGLIVAALAVSGIITFGIHLVTVGWPT